MYNLPGVKNLLHMDGPTLANIFMGKITTWNDPAIAKLNPGVIAPEHEDLDRAPLGQLGHDLQLHRLPFQRQPGLELADRHAAWRSTGRSARAARAAPVWPALVTQTPGSIGYADVASPPRTTSATSAMKNRSGKFATPGMRGSSSAAQSDQKPAADDSLSIVNPPAKFANSYPISTFTYVIVAQQSSKAAGPEEVPVLGRHQGPDLRPEAAVRAAPQERARRRREVDREDPLVRT